MELVNVPASFPLYWGQNAGGSYIRNIPVNSQIGITNGAASLNDGFPPDTFQPAGAGGVPPFGQDFNGVLRQLSQWSQWQEAGAPVSFDRDFATSIGGYPAGALLRATSLPVNWINLADENSNDPDSGGANWIAQGGGTATIASAATVDLSTTWAYIVNVTGTTAITSLGTLPAGVTKVLIFGGILTLSYNATSLILPGAANITTAAGDVAVVTSLGSGNWKCMAYLPASGQALVPAAAGSITNSQLANMAAGTIKGNNAGTPGSPADLTGAQATALLVAFTGDSGTGGAKGLVPAPTAGQAAAGDYLSAGGSFTAPPAPGVGQTWSNPSRSIGTQYQNTTGSPIEVKVVISMASNQNAAFKVGSASASTEIDACGAGGGAAVVTSIGGIVPNGWYYEVTGNGGVSVWSELS